MLRREKKKKKQNLKPLLVKTRRNPEELGNKGGHGEPQVRKSEQKWNKQLSKKRHDKHKKTESKIHKKTHQTKP